MTNQTQSSEISGVMGFLTRARGGSRLEITDMLSYLYLLLGTIIMFGPVLWLVMSSFKVGGEVTRFPPRFLPYQQETVRVEGYARPLPLYEMRVEGEKRQFGLLDRTGLIGEVVDPGNPSTTQCIMMGETTSRRTVDVPGYDEPLIRYGTVGDDCTIQWYGMVERDANSATLVNPDNPDEVITVARAFPQPVEVLRFSLQNYRDGLQGQSFQFWRFLSNSLIVTTAATILTLVINSMAAFSLSKYRYQGRNAIFLIIISTLMVPLSVILVPAFLLITEIGWNNNLLGVIVPGAATPTGVFLLRQYMLTIPDELMDSARIDGASEWRIYSQIILPLAAPALAVLAIFSVMWRWNDFLWPKIVLTQREFFTLQVGLETFKGDLQIQWDLILAMTVLTILPITLVFGFLQRYITSGIATTGMK